MKRTKPTPSRTQSLQSALRTWDKAYNAHQHDLKQRGNAILDTKRLKLLLAQKQAFHTLNEIFHKLIHA